MCVILSIEKPISEKRLGKNLPLEDFEKAARLNPDGFGIAWWSRKFRCWKYQKGLIRPKESPSFPAGIIQGDKEQGDKEKVEAPSTIESDGKWAVEDIYQRFVELPAPKVIHFRKASVGQKEAGFLCHPFSIPFIPHAPMKGKAPYLLFHNGTMSGWEHQLINVIISSDDQRWGQLNINSMSDTKALAIILTEISRKSHSGWLRFAAEHFADTSAGRVAICGPKGIIKRYGEWFSHGSKGSGIKVSNRNLSPVITRWRAGSKSLYEWETDPLYLRSRSSVKDAGPERGSPFDDDSVVSRGRVWGDTIDDDYVTPAFMDDEEDFEDFDEPDVFDDDPRGFDAEVARRMGFTDDDISLMDRLGFTEKEVAAMREEVSDHKSRSQRRKGRSR